MFEELLMPREEPQAMASCSPGSPKTRLKCETCEVVHYYMYQIVQSYRIELYWNVTFFGLFYILGKIRFKHWM